MEDRGLQKVLRYDQAAERHAQEPAVEAAVIANQSLGNGPAPLHPSDVGSQPR